MAAAICAYHPDRPAHALCMSCGKSVCQECATTWDGIHYCAACVAEKRRGTEERRSWLAVLPTTLIAAFLCWAVARLTVWSLVNTLAFWR